MRSDDQRALRGRHLLRATAWRVLGGFAVAAVVATGCASEEQDTLPTTTTEAAAAPGLPALEPVAAGQTVRFTDAQEASGIDYVQHPPEGSADCFFDLEPEAIQEGDNCIEERMTGGVALGDYDNDGHIDVFVTRLRGSPILYRNNGDATFVDVSEEAGFSDFVTNTNGASWADVDNDGHLDLYVTTRLDDQHLFFHNNGDSTFTEQAVERGLALDSGVLRGGQSVNFGDYDLDGYVDVFVTEWLHYSRSPRAPSAHARLLRNRGAEMPGHFEDVTVEAGVVLSDPDVVDPVPLVPLEVRESYINVSFSAAFVDLDDDGFPDLAIASDFGTSQLFWNNGDGTFSEGSAVAGIGDEGNAMGSTFGDFDGDGRFDWFVTAIFDPERSQSGRPAPPEYQSYTGNRLYRNLGDRTFENVTTEAGVQNGFWGWGTAFADLDNDGFLDIIMTNGQDFGADVPDADRRFRRTPKRLWRNLGDGTFEEVAEAAGIDTTREGKSLAVADLDGDGALDLFIANNRQQPNLYLNHGTTNAWLRVKVTGTRSNRDGLGAVVEIEDTAGRTQVRQIGVATHFLGQSERVAHFGLGADAAPVTVTVTWPASGEVQVFEEVEPNQVLEVVEPA